MSQATPLLAGKALRRGEAAAVPRWDYISSGEHLTAVQERELASRAQAGDERARERMMRANIPLVVSIARQYGSPHLEAEDLIQEGMIGLCTALDRFSPARGFRFSTYATYWIRQRILRALDRSGRLIRLPVDVGTAARKLEVLRAELSAELGREPTLQELAPACGISARRLQAVLECMEDPVPLHAPTSDDADPLTLEVADPSIADPSISLIQEEAALELRRLLETLSGRDRMVLEGRFGLDGNSVSLAELADRLRVTSEGVRQIQRRALLRLRRRWLELQAEGAASGTG